MDRSGLIFYRSCCPLAASKIALVCLWPLVVPLMSRIFSPLKYWRTLSAVLAGSNPVLFALLETSAVPAISEIAAAMGCAVIRTAMVYGCRVSTREQRGVREAAK